MIRGARHGGGARACISAGLAAAALACAAGPRWTAPATLAPAAGRDFSLRWEAIDPNGLPLNPFWAGQPQTADALPPRQPACVNALPDSPVCTDQPTSRDGPAGPHADACAVDGGAFQGHINWTPVTYTGRLWWGHLADDGDVNLSFEADDPWRGLTAGNDIAPQTGRPFLQVEFLASEVVTRAATDFWRGWWRRIEQWAASSIDATHIERLLNARRPGASSRAVIVALFGLDCGHDCKAELHPVYALAVEVNDDPQDNTWAIFARNWGTEGYCSRGNHFLIAPHDRLTIDLPARGGGAPRVDLARTQFATTYAGTPPPSLRMTADHAVRLTFALPPPDASAVSELVLHLDWTGATTPDRLARAPFAADAALPASGAASPHVALAALAASTLARDNRRAAHGVLTPEIPAATGTPSTLVAARPAVPPVLTSDAVLDAKRRGDEARLRRLCTGVRGLMDDLGPLWRRACAAVGVR